MLLLLQSPPRRLLAGGTPGRLPAAWQGAVLQ